jgi:calcium-dependent protein kinase
MLTHDPSARISVYSALEHRWFRNVSQQQHVVPERLIRQMTRQKSSSLLSREAMKVIVKYLPSEAISELRVRPMQDYFTFLDPQNTGFITAEGLQEALTRSGYSFAVEEIEGIVSKHDILGQGRIKYTDFLIATLDRKAILDEDNLWIAFKYFDLENSGKLTLSNIHTSLIQAGCNVTEEDIEFICTEYNISQSDFVDFNNFKRIMVVMNTMSPYASEKASPQSIAVRRLPSNLQDARTDISKPTEGLQLSLHNASSNGEALGE